jgi:hypothetical protein
LAVRGTEDLGGGLKAFFQLETGFKPDENNTTFAARNSAVGPSGWLGQRLMGAGTRRSSQATTAIDRSATGPSAGFRRAHKARSTSPILPAARRQARNGQYDGFDRARPEQHPVLDAALERAPRFAREYSVNELKSATINPSLPAQPDLDRGTVVRRRAYDHLKDFRPTLRIPRARCPGRQCRDSKAKAAAVFGNFAFGAFKLAPLYETSSATALRSSTRPRGPSGLQQGEDVGANANWTFGNSQLMYQYTNAKDGGARFVTSAP